MTAQVDQADVWKPIPGYEGRYEVSPMGQVRSLPRRGVRGGTLTPMRNADGYLQIALRSDGKMRMLRLHRIVAKAFVAGSNPLHCEVAHLDGDRANARADNLKWVSRVENMSHKRLHGTHQSGERHPQAILRERDVLEILKRSESAKEAAAKYGVSWHTVSDIRRGRLWKDLHAKHESAVAKPCAQTQPGSGS